MKTLDEQGGQRGKLISAITNHPYLTLAFVAIAILIIILVVVSVQRLYSASLRIVVAPSNAEITINGQRYENGLYEGLRTGMTQVNIAAEGYTPQSFEVELRPDETTKIYLCLDSEDETLKQTEDYVTNCALVKEFYGEREKEEFLKKYPIANDIPIVVEYYSQDYTSYVYYRIDMGEYKDCESKICLKITDLSGGNYDRAIAEIRRRGYNPDNYEIIYEDSSKKGHAG